MRRFGLIFLILCQVGLLRAQQYDLLIKNGRVIDPGNHVDSKLDIAITDGKIAKVDKSIAASESKKVVDASGLIVTPGLIDIHTHVFAGSKPDTFADGSNSVSADDFTFKSGVTTVVDAGTSGWRNFPVFKSNVIDKSQTRILAFLNIAGSGLSGNPGMQDLNDMDVQMTANMIQRYPEIIVGVKIGHYEGPDWAPFDRALEVGNITKLPMLVECHLPQFSLEDQLRKMRPGDIITHSYEEITERQPIVDAQGKVRSFVLDARKRGVLFDVGHGGYGFWFSEAIPAMRQGLAPDTFGSDLHRFSMNAGMKSMLNIMSKYMAMGMEVPDIIQRATWNAARSIKRQDLGTLSEGAVADIAVLSIAAGNFGFVDAGGNKIEGTRKFEAELTVRAGKVVWDLNGLSALSFKK